MRHGGGRGAAGGPPSDLHRETEIAGALRAEGSGGEPVRVALCFPSTYSFGMSNLGFQSVLRLLDEEPDVVCERVFHDAGPTEPGRSYETGTPLSDFDVVAFSVSFEDDYFNLVSLLSAGGVPVMAEDRGEGDPLVVLGGVCAHLNPEPVAPFLDAVLVGDAEALVRPFLAAVARGGSRAERLDRVSRMKGAYVPGLYEVERDHQGRIVGFAARRGAKLPVEPADAVGRIARTHLLSDGAYFEDMFLVETSRGCARGCRFCAAGQVLRPRRHHGLADIVEELRAASASTSRVGLVTAALLDHPEAGALLSEIRDMGLELNISSVRAEGITAENAVLLESCGVRTVTLAPEAADERLRRVIGKPMSDGTLMRAVRALRDARMNNLKLYFMVGLPGERPADIEAIPGLSREIHTTFASGRPGGRVTVSVSAFVPKPRTPFQWLPMAGESYLRDAIRFLRRELSSKPALEFSATGPREARREGALARGGRELAPAIAASALDGVPWKAALRRSGADASHILDRERDEDEVFPWETVSVGTPRSRLLSSLDEARRLMALLN